MSLVSLWLCVCGATGHMSLVFLGGKNEFDAFVETEINGVLNTSFTVQFRILLEIQRADYYHKYQPYCVTLFITIAIS